MVNVDFSPMLAASLRSSRTAEEWNVEIHIRWAVGPISPATRSRISAAALFVKVMARISCGRARPVASSHAMRWVSTRVLPEPAPATISSGAPVWVTAAACCGLSPATSDSGVCAGAAGRASSPQASGSAATRVTAGGTSPGRAVSGSAGRRVRSRFRGVRPSAEKRSAMADPV